MDYHHRANTAEDFVVYEAAMVRLLGFPGGSVAKNLPASAGDTRVQSLGQEDPPENEMATCSGILPCKIHGQRSLVGYGPWGHKESDTTEGHTHTHTHTHTSR